MNRTLHDRLLWGLLAVVACVVVGLSVRNAWQSPDLKRPSIDSEVADFTLIERAGGRISRDDLRGKVWIAGLTFNCCTTSCPQIRQAMQELQSRLRSTGVYLVNISLDPEVDTPESLRALADSLQADPRRWLFFTGDAEHGKDYVYSVVEQSFLTRPVIDPAAEPGRRIAHTSRLFLVDRDGKVCGRYECVGEMLDKELRPAGVFEVDEAELASLAEDADALDGGPLRRLIRLPNVPTLNATLNTASFLLLVAGFLFIRRLRVRAHLVCMLAAVGVSTLFLAFYIYYHFHYGHTRFPDVPIKPLYLALLFSHILGAIAIAVLVPRTLYLAARRRFDKHRRVARWTLPIWLYVSVTGVIVYVFLYHLYPK